MQVKDYFSEIQNRLREFAFIENVDVEYEIKSKTVGDGFDKGYKKGMNDWAILVNCSVCGELGYIKPQSDVHKVCLEGVPFIPWGHKSCLEGKRISDLPIPGISKLFLVAGRTTSSKSEEKKE